jgi:hypothetical protein
MKHLRNFAWGDRVNCINEPAVVDPSQFFVDYERVGTLEFGKRMGLNQRTGSC